MNRVPLLAAGQSWHSLPVPPGGQGMGKNRAMREVH
jgi:hypothetical protein